MDVTVQLVVYIVITNILERRSTCCTLEAFHMQVLVLDTYKHTTADHTGRKYSNSVQNYRSEEGN
jgi:hypothetical protein